MKYTLNCFTVRSHYINRTPVGKTVFTPNLNTYIYSCKNLDKNNNFYSCKV